MSIAILPSLISGDVLNLEKEIKKLEPLCDGFHIDVMDGHFVPNLTWGPVFINALVRVSSLPLHVHYMVTDPAFWIERCTLRQQDFFTFHFEAYSSQVEIERTIAALKKKNVKVGLALKPQTKAEAIFRYASLVDQILIMSVEPGFSGQSFIPTVIEKIDTLAAFKKNNKLSCSLAIDGGIRIDLIEKLAQKGIEQFALAAAIFCAPDPVGALRALHALAK